ncbi:MAG: SRPBCC domain-containing protein [Chitinophagaceae bacterium]|nr:SRPBCC domain-containing protein [Chitinophagaceae bacterium]
MAKTILQTIQFRNTDVSVLYNLYMDAKLHSVVTGGTAKIQRKEGAKFSAYDNYCFGKNLQLIPNQLIVQSWRAADWAAADAESTFILLFEQTGKDATVYMTHANVPGNQFKALKDGWNSFYWKPWKACLKNLKK